MRLVVGGVLFAAAAFLACGQHDEIASADESAVVAATSCTVWSALDGRDLSAAELADLNDPVAQKLLAGEGCPSTFDEIAEKVARTDAKDCEHNEGVSAHLVNDTAFLTKTPGGLYRAVIDRDCDGRPKGFDTGLSSGGGHEFFMSLFGVDVAAPKLPQTHTEAAGLDRGRGVYNFYVREPARWIFMGSSASAVAAGYDCNPRLGTCIPRSAQKARCFACHESGGLNMKELEAPWNSWDNDNGTSPGVRIPGHEALLEKHRVQIGKIDSGRDLQFRIENGNSAWNGARVRVLREKGAAEALRPLFCTMTMNLRSGGAGAELDAIPQDFLVHPLLGSKRIRVTHADYVDLLAANHQRIETSAGPLVTDAGPVIDTQTPFRFIRKGEIDIEYVRFLIGARIVDKDFVEDVAHVDFTRPVFSPTRCALLDFAPDLAGADLTTERVREGFAAKLRGSTQPGAAQLLANVEHSGDGPAHQHDVDAFLAACKARPSKELLADALLVLSNDRRRAIAHRGATGAGAGQGFIELRETLPVDDLPASNAALDPVTCTLH